MRGIMIIDLFSSDIKDAKDYIFVGNIENKIADSRISELKPIRAICKSDARDIHGGMLITHKALRIHKDDYLSYNNSMQRSIIRNYQWN